MANDLSRRFRKNVIAIQEHVGENAFTFGRRIFPTSPDQYRVQIYTRPHLGFTLGTLEHYASRLHINPCDLIDAHFNPREHTYEQPTHHRHPAPKPPGVGTDLEGKPGDGTHQAGCGARP